MVSGIIYLKGVLARIAIEEYMSLLYLPPHLHPLYPGVISAHSELLRNILAKFSILTNLKHFRINPKSESFFARRNLKCLI